MIMPSQASNISDNKDTQPLLISYVEVWRLNEGGTALDRSTTRFVGQPDREDSNLGHRTLKPGEGIAGAAWKQRSVVLIQDQPNNRLQQIVHETDRGLAAVVALPVFCQNEILGVLVLGLTESFGAVEVWARDERDELAIADAHYSGLPSFEFITRYTRFPKGAGVPGAVWKSGLPKIAHDLKNSAGFIRSFGNDPATVSTAVGLPIAMSGGFPASVLLFLEASDAPLSRRTELVSCEPDKSGDGVIATSVQVVGQLQPTEANSWHQSVAQQIHSSGGPCLMETPSSESSDFHVAWPVYAGNQLVSFLGLTF